VLTACAVLRALMGGRGTVHMTTRGSQRTGASEAPTPSCGEQEDPRGTELQHLLPGCSGRWDPTGPVTWGGRLTRSGNSVLRFTFLLLTQHCPHLHLRLVSWFHSFTFRLCCFLSTASVFTSRLAQDHVDYQPAPLTGAKISRMQLSPHCNAKCKRT
jgi:hypothetical protein